MPDDMSPMDRDCIVAAILTNGMSNEYDAAGERLLVERYARILRELRQESGTMGMWQQAETAAQRKIERRERRKAAGTD